MLAGQTDWTIFTARLSTLDASSVLKAVSIFLRLKEEICWMISLAFSAAP